MGLIDGLLEAGSMLDWVTPAVAFGRDLAAGGGHTFGILDASGHTPRAIGQELRRRGIASWGMRIVDGDLLLTVRKSEAVQASRLLESWGVKLQNPAKASPASTSTAPAWPAHGGQTPRPIRGRSRLWRLLEKEGQHED